jgi:hypothetical protein
LSPQGWKNPPCAMPSEYKTSHNAVSCYRIYYEKGKATILGYTRRSKPHWLSSSYK